jgi:hypothetical protein
LNCYVYLSRSFNFSFRIFRTKILIGIYHRKHRVLENFTSFYRIWCNFWREIWISPYFQNLNCQGIHYHRFFDANSAIFPEKLCKILRKTC